MRKNLFIALEGIDGCGKSTQAKLLAEHFKNEGHSVYVTAEPTDSRIGSTIRDIFRHKMEADHKTIAALYVADRLHHLLNKENGILKKLEEGYTVITDRYYFSSYAYQGLHVPMDWVMQANSLSAELLRPDLNIYIDITPEVSMKRLNKSRDIIELYESVDNLRMVREKYFEAFDLMKLQENIFITDGDRQPEVIAADIWKKVSQIGVLSNSDKV
jgi:dTMP kinase